MFDVFFHKQFLEGSTVNGVHADAKALTDAEVEHLLNFFNRIIEGKTLKGRNKESYTDQTGKLIFRALNYKKYNAWHYHSGPYDKQPKVWTLPSLPTNLDGSHSAPVVHYIKAKGKVIIIGYSRDHIPFPDGDSRSNKLRTRLFNWASNLANLTSPATDKEAHA